MKSFQANDTTLHVGQKYHKNSSFCFRGLTGQITNPHRNISNLQGQAFPDCKRCCPCHLAIWYQTVQKGRASWCCSNQPSAIIKDSEYQKLSPACITSGFQLRYKVLRHSDNGPLPKHNSWVSKWKGSFEKSSHLAPSTHSFEGCFLYSGEHKEASPWQVSLLLDQAM